MRSRNRRHVTSEFLGFVFLLTDLDTCSAKDIAESLFSSTDVFVLQQKELGRFPRPSWTTPGNRGKHVWLVETVKRWHVEFLARSPEPLEIGVKLKRKESAARNHAYRHAVNDAAVTATKIAEQFDAELKSKLFNCSAGSVPSRESNIGTDQSEMVPA